MTKLALIVAFLVLVAAGGAFDRRRRVARRTRPVYRVVEEHRIVDVP